MMPPVRYDNCLALGSSPYPTLTNGHHGAWASHDVVPETNHQHYPHIISPYPAISGQQSRYTYPVASREEAAYDTSDLTYDRSPASDIPSSTGHHVRVQPHVGTSGLHHGTSATMHTPVLTFPEPNHVPTSRHHNDTSMGVWERETAHAKQLISIAPKPPGYQAPPLDIRKVTPDRRKRKRFDDEGLIQVNETRQRGACLRCKSMKSAVSVFSRYRPVFPKCRIRVPVLIAAAQCGKIPCDNCLEVIVQENTKVYHSLCVNPRLDDFQAFRAGDADNGSVRPFFPLCNWLSEPDSVRKNIELTWPFNDSDSPILHIELRLFQPEKERLKEIWRLTGHTTDKVVDFAPWACSVRETYTRVHDFLMNCQKLLKQEITLRLRDEPLMSLTWHEVMRYHHTYEEPLLKNALLIYTGAMMNTEYPRSTDFGAKIEDTDEVSDFERWPVPPYLVFQFQTMVADIMVKYQLEVKKRLKAHIFDAPCRRRNWYLVFLAMFVLLSTIEMVSRKQISWIERKRNVGDEQLRENVLRTSKTMIEEWEYSAFNLISHWRCVMKGNVPFAVPAEKNKKGVLPEATGPDAESAKFLVRLQEEVEKQHERLVSARASRKKDGKYQYAQPLSALCELFLREQLPLAG